MPHITVKLLSVLNDSQKVTLADKMASALCEEIGCLMDHVSVDIEEYDVKDINNLKSTITLKMLEGRSDAQKQNAAQKLAEIFYQVTELHYEVNVMVGEFTPEEWQDVYADEIKGRSLIRKPDYDPKDLLK